MKAVAIIPARGGSKGIPRKNIRSFCGKPLIAWTIEAALAAESIDRVIVSTDDAEIAEVARNHGAGVVWRPAEFATDTATSESALLHALQVLGITEGRLAFLQCTSPLTIPKDIDGTVALLDRYDCGFTAAASHAYIWEESDGFLLALGHDKAKRLPRQQREPQYVETGAVYAMDIEGFIAERRRFFGGIGMHLVSRNRAVEIDDETDWILAETLMRQRLGREKAATLPSPVEALVMDFDGVLTDNRVTVTESGRERVTCSRADGWALQELRGMGTKLLVLTTEASPVVEARCRKISVDFARSLRSDEKLSVLKAWLNREGVDPRRAVYVGNDVPDVACMEYVGCGVAPSDAYPEARRAAQIVTEAAGGAGVIRELYGLIVEQKGGSIHESVGELQRLRS